MEDRYDISVDIGEGSDMSCWVERVSCWGGKSFIDHDDTHDKVYELNRQMCDIDKHLSEAGYFRMICDGQIETRKKLIDMEEKKTKKMTKAEAFEYLKEKSGEEDALDFISTVGARLSEVLRNMEGHKHVVITEDDVILYEEGMCLFHSDPF